MEICLPGSLTGRLSELLTSPMELQHPSKILRKGVFLVLLVSEGLVSIHLFSDALFL